MSRPKSNKPQKERMPLIREEAWKSLVIFIRKEGFKGEISIIEYERSKKRWYFQLSSPRGLFFVDGEKKIEDNSNYFFKKTEKC